MKLLQANIWGGRLNSQLLNLLREEDPDIICLQEAISTPGATFVFTTVQDIQAQLGYDHAFFSPVFTFQYSTKKAGFGNAIISKLPIVEEETIFTGLEHIDDLDFDKHSLNIRNLQHAVIEVGSKKLNILNHHGHHINEHKNGDKETMRQCKMIADYAAGLSGPVILTGDFNLAPHSESLGQINQILQNLSVSHQLKTTRTHLTHKTEVCDYVFISSEVAENKFYASDEIASDHKALVLEFAIS